MAFTLDIPNILQYGWAGKQWCVRGDQKDYANLEWLDQSAKPTEQAMLDAELAAAKSWRSAKVNTEATERIYAEWDVASQCNTGMGLYDADYLPTKNVTGATNASPIVITCAGHGYKTGDKVTIVDVGGNTAANVSDNLITKVDAGSFSLNGTTGNGDYTSGGTVKRQKALACKNDVNTIRLAANTAKSDIAALETVSAVLAFTW